ncbi:skin secretory protein xP2-like, partial [Callorhinchus milii]|uniref:skin secretory protein xP2-like n=1 Tax=Callorhinchus milii TaxID=7868 RepID=UPI001C3FA4D1
MASASGRWASGPVGGAEPEEPTEGASTPEDTGSLLSENDPARAGEAEEPTQDFRSPGWAGAGGREEADDTQQFARLPPPPGWLRPEPADRRREQESAAGDTEPLGSPASSGADTEPVSLPWAAQGGGQELSAPSASGARAEPAPSLAPAPESAPQTGSDLPEWMETQSPGPGAARPEEVGAAAQEKAAAATDPALVEQVNELERSLAHALDLGSRETQQMDTSDQTAEVGWHRAEEQEPRPPVAGPGREVRETARGEGRVEAFAARASKPSPADADTETKPGSSRPRAELAPRAGEEEETQAGGGRPAEGRGRAPRTQGEAADPPPPSGTDAPPSSAPPRGPLEAAAQDRSPT